jgi:hypothetical protein
MPATSSIAKLVLALSELDYVEDAGNSQPDFHHLFSLLHSADECYKDSNKLFLVRRGREAMDNPHLASSITLWMVLGSRNQNASKITHLIHHFSSLLLKPDPLRAHSL